MPLERATLHVMLLDRTSKVLLSWLICYIFVFHITQLLLILEGNYEYVHCKCEQHVCDISLCVFFISVEESCPTLLCRIFITQSRWPAAKNRCLSESFRCYSGFQCWRWRLWFLWPVCLSAIAILSGERPGRLSSTHTWVTRVLPIVTAAQLLNIGWAKRSGSLWILSLQGKCCKWAPRFVGSCVIS